MTIRALIVSLLAVLLALPAAAQDDPEIKVVERKNANGVVVEKYKTVDGKKEGAYQSFFDDGTKRSEGTHLHDRRHGAWVDYHSNGNKSFEGNYNKGDLNGAAAVYHANGQVGKSATFANGYAKGTFTTYYEDGQVRASGEVSSSQKNQLEHVTHEGDWKWYYADGTTEWETTYRDGNWHGTSVQFHKNGNKYLEGTFENGYATGTRKGWHDNGQLESEGEVSSGQKNSFDHPRRQGAWKYYFRDGVVSWDGSYENSNWHGEVASYHHNGTEYFRCNFVRGHAQGTLTRHYDNGQLHGQGEVSDSQKNSFDHVVYQGPWIWYHDNGNKYWEGGYQDQNWHGEITQYHSNGAKYVNAEYSNGIAGGTWTQYHSNGQIAAIGEAVGSRKNSLDHMVRDGLWALYYEEGTREFEGTYIEGKLDGIASWYHSNGQKSALTEWIEGKMRGSWTGWHDNGNKSGHGYSYDGYGTSPKKHGPWVWYHSNGKKSSEGKYHYDKAHGPWVFYDTKGLVDKVVNYDEGKELKGNSEAELQDGSRIISTSNPDGSRDTYKIDKDGNLVDHEHTLPPDKQKPSITYEDPETGETTTLTHDGDGNVTITKGKTTTDEDGTTHTHEVDDDGTVRDITVHPDGSREFRETRPDGTVRESTRDKDGNVVRKQTNPDGSTVEYTKSPDGRKTRTLRDAEGNVIEEAERTPVGVETVKKPDGTTTRRHKDENGNWVETTERPDGTTSRVVRDSDGNVLSRDDKWGQRDPGQSVYEDIQGGRNWDSLSDEEKEDYADLEGRMRENGQLESARNRAAEAEMRRRDEERASADTALEEAGADLERRPATDGATRPPENGITRKEIGLAAKAAELALRMPDVGFERLKDELSKLAGDDEELLKELMEQNESSLPGFLGKHPKLAQKWTQAAKSGGSAVAAALAVSEGVDLLYEGKYGEALEKFAGASASAFGAIPPGMMAEIEGELGNNPAKSAAAVKNMIAFAREATRELKPGESRNVGTLLNEGAQFLVNAWESLPKDKRASLLEKQLPTLKKLLDNVDKGIGGTSVKRSNVIMGLLDAAPEVFKLIDEWGGENHTANWTAAVQKVGPKAIGLLVQAATRSETAGAAAEFAAQVGTDFLAHLGNEAREAAKGAMLAAGTDSASYARMRSQLQALAQEAGMTRRDAEEFETVQNLVSGHRGGLVLSDMRRQNDLLGIREAMQAWRRVDNNLNKKSVAVNAFYNRLGDPHVDGESHAYNVWRNNEIEYARRTSRYISEIISEYDRNGAAHKYLSAWKHDLDYMVRTFG